MNKLKIVGWVAIGLTVIQGILSKYADSIAREDMKKEILEELQNKNRDS